MAGMPKTFGQLSYSIAACDASVVCYERGRSILPSYMMILRPESLLFASLIAAPTWAADSRSSDSGRPRGVSPECKSAFPSYIPHFLEL